MEDFDDIDNDLDNLVDYYSDKDNDENVKQQEHNKNEEQSEKRSVPVKVRVRKPQPKLNAERLRGPRGLSVLPKWFEAIQLKGKHHESEDLNVVINRLEQWTHRLFPKYTFDDAIAKLEKLGSKNDVKVIIKRIRLGLDDIVTQTEEDIVEPLAPPTQDDVFDRIANTVDIFPVTSTPNVRNTGLTEEQRQRMMRNRMLAEERRQAKIKARQQQELNASHTTVSTITTIIDSS
ncbi:Chromosome segregation in meiosis protein 3 [Cinara cedri]|uniref:TIMELESS-interacting protein n=1 Tax=Cinara cedri TaxID=506608 RepID=A0A5E4MNE0_9HEMI|nr:Chromosome segregation in meiosis protein 3 [Cinara cedri]